MLTLVIILFLTIKDLHGICFLKFNLLNQGWQSNIFLFFFCSFVCEDFGDIFFIICRNEVCVSLILMGEL